MSDCVLTKNINSPEHIQIINSYLLGYNKLTICTSFRIRSPKSPGNNGLCGDLNTSVFHSENWNCEVYLTAVWSEVHLAALSCYVSVHG